jgi:hypothetical protein
MAPVLIAKLIKTKFAKLYSHFASIACIAPVAHIFGNAEYLSSYQIIMLGCKYFWQPKVIVIISNHCASIARIFGNSELLSSY